MTDKENLPEWIDRFTNNELEGDELQKFIEMLRSDPELRKEVKLDHDLNVMLLDEDMLEFRKKLMSHLKKDGHQRLSPGQLLLAATLLLLIGIGFLIYKTGLNGDMNIVNQKISMVNPDSIDKDSIPDLQIAVSSVKKKIDKDTLSDPGKPSVIHRNQRILASNYIPYPAFESLVGTKMRSWEFLLVAPKQIRIQKGSDIRFQWETRRELNVSLKIMDNRGNLVYDGKPGITKILEIKENKLNPGLYYFKFLANDEIIYFGKFEIG